MKIKKGDTILVIAGRDRGKTGKVTSVNPTQQTVKVSGINISKKHLRPKRGAAGGGITEVAVPLSISKVMFMCSHCNKPVRLGSKTTTAGNKERICRVCKSTV
ncbi:TPA: 50S ribosomal protein L24 [Patescibacteria group bacterium]|uniref:Large ribosomal subunit protein uL24 n=1 Tax=candidate division Kazan bacterium GW2011_GWA1_44_22 TaxID=1620410 RepID=A0A0G1KYF3_UNCK3|nr:MAG: 50S ribosomal protein L24 [candidate division Kazan bacterium GW2011_GWA1_44_22]HAR55030.1 50S ribosomal protein L24 [Patescibacteria group bacterium]HCR41910.1 50S ribosomal protein L24 [Patescibacteria group bacterium]